MSLQQTFSSDELLGRDLQFPLMADGHGRLMLTSGLDNVAQSILNWLRTRVGETMYMRDKGIDARRYVHMDKGRIKRIAPSEIETGLMRWEKRLERVTVTVQDVDSGDSMSRDILIRIRFKAIDHAIEGMVTYSVVAAGGG
jgi:phage baseplate assembly protein W